MQKTVNLRHLTIIWDYRFREHQTPEKEMEQMEQLKRIDHKTMPLKIARTLGSLDCLVLENGQSNEHQLISNKDPLEKSYWKVGTRGVGEVVVEQVSEEEGETLVTKATQSKSRTI